MSNLEIVYLHHSGFAITTKQHLLVFDYYQDPAALLSSLIQTGKKIYIFSSHAHADHFNPKIGGWQNAVLTYFLSDDIREAGGLRGVKPDKVRYLGPYETVEQDVLKVVTYGSTDEGISFFVEVDGWRLFHAGDLNWWHWKGDTPDNLRLAEDGFRKEMKLLDGLKLDVAFFPVDSRLEEYRAMGIEVFGRSTDVGQLIAMHTTGEPWKPPVDFPGNGKKVAVWCPVSPGERLQIDQA